MNRREFVQGAVGTTVLTSSMLASALPAEEPHEIAYYLDASSGSPAEIALRQLQAACDKKSVALRRVQSIDEVRSGYLLVLGSGSQPSPARQMAVRLGPDAPANAESFIVRHDPQADRHAILAYGADPLGLAYAIHSIAEQIECAPGVQPALDSLASSSESPAVRDRTLSTYCMQQAYFEARLFDEKYWDLYLNNMVRNRFNNFSLLFAYESSGFLAPPYPWFFDLPEFPEVKAAGVTPEQQQRYLNALNRLITMTHERGLQFTLGIWDHIYDGYSSYYTEGVWDHLPLVNGRKPRWPVEGLTDKNLVAYTPKALAHFLELVPNLDGIQFRMHGESGLSKAGMQNFWVPIFKIMADTSPKIRFDARAKEFPYDLIYKAVDMGVDLRLATKFTTEQVVTPFHPMHLQPYDQFGTRYSYFDMLRYPKRYKVQWRLWTSGTLRVLLWGQPEFARRFAQTTHLYDADGYEVAEPLATKMASQPHDEPPIPLLNAGYRYYDYEFQRYWPFFFAFGRVGYGLPAGDNSLKKLYELHYGRAAAPQVQQALQLASDIQPRIVAYCLPLLKVPTTRGWPARQRWEDLPAYSAADPFDVALFASFDEETDMTLHGGVTTKIRLEETRRWFAERSAQVLQAAQAAEDAAPKPLSKEMVSTLTDLRILAHLAEYHQHRIQAGLAYSLYRKTGDLFALDNAIAHETDALQAWHRIVDAAGDVYSRQLAMGLQIAATPTHEPGDLSGSWVDEIPKLELGLQNLKAERDGYQPGRNFIDTWVFDSNPELPTEHLLQLPHQRSFSIDMPNGRYYIEFDARQDYLFADRVFGPMWIEANGADRTPTFTVPSGGMVTQALTTDVRDGRLNIFLGYDSNSQPILNRMHVYRIEDVLSHVPVRKIAAGSGPDSGIALRATVSGTNPIRKVEAVWIGASGQQSIHLLQSESQYRYTATLPASLCGNGGSYFLRATDSAGKQFTSPEQGAATPIHVTLSEKAFAPEFAHAPVLTAKPGQPLRITAKVRSAQGLHSVALRYRSVTQYQDYYNLEMQPTTHTGEFAAEVPGEHIPVEFDFAYYFEIIDNQGNGWIRPDMDIETPYIIVQLDRTQA